MDGLIEWYFGHYIFHPSFKFQMCVFFFLFVCFQLHVFMLHVFLICLPAGEAPLQVHFVRCPSLPGGPHVSLRWMLHMMRYWMYQSTEIHSLSDSVAVRCLILVYSFYNICLLTCGFELYGLACNLDMNRLQAHGPDCLMWGGPKQ